MSYITLRKTVLGLAVASVTQLSSMPGLAESARPFRMDFAGGFLNNIEQTDIDMMGVPTGTSPTGIVLTKARGSLGRADVMAVTKSGPPVSSWLCPEGFTKVADITHNNLLFTFSNLALLWGDGEGIVCLNNVDFTQYVEISGSWDGGTKQYEGAGGEWSISIDQFDSVSTETQFVAETGRFTGTLTINK